MMTGGDGHEVLWIVLTLFVWFMFVAAALTYGAHIVRTRRPPVSTLPSPLDILERRYAAGEIDREQFDDARARLREHELDL